MRFKQRIRNWLFSDDNNKVEIEPSDGTSVLISSNGLHFNVYKADGGTVVEVYPQVDPHAAPMRGNSSTNKIKLYIIKDSDNMAEELSKIMTIELLRT